MTGVTGGEVQVDDELRGFLARARAGIDAPLAVGFGSPHGRPTSPRIGEIADGVIVASQLIRMHRRGARAPRPPPRRSRPSPPAAVAALRGMAPAR